MASPDRQANSVYLDNPAIATAPACGANREFMVVRATVYNRSNLHARDLSVQLMTAAGAPAGSTPSFDLAPGASATKTVPVGSPVSGKIEIRVMDPKHTVTGVRGNPGVYVVVKPSCSIAAQPIDTAPTLVLRPRP